MEQIAYRGNTSIERLLPILRPYAGRRIFLVRGKRSYESCGARRILDAVFARLNLSVVEFFDFEENPKEEDLQRGLSLVKDQPVSAFVAVGGGSVLDMAKLVRFFHAYTGDIVTGKYERKQDRLPLIAVPTTAGTGSEATHFAVLYRHKVKYSVEHDDVLPDTAIVYPPFTYHNPAYLTACTGFDALAQAIEAFWNVNATEESDGYARKAIESIWPDLPVAVNAPTPEVRDRVAEGAYWAGRAINITKTTAPHAFSYYFTTQYKFPHGHAVALLFARIFAYNTEAPQTAIPETLLAKGYVRKMELLREMLGVRQMQGCKKLLDYIHGIGLDTTLPADLTADDLISSVNLKRLSNNPIPLAPADIVRLLDGCL